MVHGGSERRRGRKPSCGRIRPQRVELLHGASLADIGARLESLQRKPVAVVVGRSRSQLKLVGLAIDDSGLEEGQDLVWVAPASAEVNILASGLVQVLIAIVAAHEMEV